MSTAQDLPALPAAPAAPVAPVLRLVITPDLDFDDAVRRVRPRLHRYAIRRLGDVHEAEELVQEALLRAYTHRDQLHTEEDLAAWTTVVTGRLVIDRLRVRGRSTSVAEVPEGTRVGRDTAEVVVARDEARTALDALDAMPSRQASLLWAREVEGKSYDELCTQFAMTEPAVRSVLTRARKSLRKEYALRGGTVPVGGLAVLAPWIAGLTWAGRARRVLNRVTAPAALGAAGVAVLGGLVLSPFGLDQGGHQTYQPLNAVVATHAATGSSRLDLPAARTSLPSVSTAAVIPRASARTVTAHAPTVIGNIPHGLLGKPVHHLTNVPCTSSPALIQAPVSGLPVGAVGVGGMQTSCSSGGADVGVDLPDGDQTGYSQVGVTLGDVDCTKLSLLTALTASSVTCTQEKPQR